MKNLLPIFLMIFGFLAFNAKAQNEFITTWKTDNVGPSTDNQITIPTFGVGYNYSIDWGDNSSDTGVTGSITHTYSSPGVYTVSITGDFPRIYFNYTGDRFKLLTIEQWGNIAWSTMYKAFTGCTQLTYNATDAPDLTAVTELAWMFADCHNFNGNINNWDISNVEYLDRMFYNAQVFNQSLSNWNTSKVIGMSYLFNQAYRFNQDISGWNTSIVGSMTYMFSDAVDFNQDIGDWDLSSATNTNYMFRGATAFDQDLGGWDISNVKFMSGMFNNSGMSPANYDNTLIGWAALPSVQTNVSMGAFGLIYCDGLAARNKLDTDYNWNITGDEPDCPSFNTTWTVAAPGQTITIPTTGSGYDYYVDWGDGTIDYNITGDASHSYAVVGTKTIKIYGDFPRIYFNGTGDRNRIRTIEEWGGIEWQSMENAFKGCEALTINATDAPDLSQATSLASMFEGARNTNVDLSTWDVSTITSMDNMLDNTFTSYINYDKTITAWAALPSLQSNVTVGAAGVPFCDEIARDQLATTNTWNFVADKKGCPFITTWETDVLKRVTIPTVGSGTNYKYYVEWGDGTVSSHTTSENPQYTYASAGTYTVKISGDFAQLDGFAITNIIKTIEQWGDIEWGSMYRAFRGNAALISNATDVPDLSNVTDMSEMFYGCSSFNADLSGWDVSNVTFMQGVFRQASSFNGNISNWDVGNVRFMNSMFSSALAFNNDISGWNVSNVEDMNAMFRFAEVFNQDISGWDVSKVTKMNDMFAHTQAFNQSIDDWNVSSVTNMASMFSNASAFNQPLSKWDVANVTIMANMFAQATNFNQPIGNWNTSSVDNMYYMFSQASSFNQPLNTWDVSGATDLSEMFSYASAFDQDLSSWDVSSGSEMSGMFYEATSFNQDISGWDVSLATDLYGMFYGASSFDQDLSAWDVGNVAFMEFMFDNSGMSRRNYDLTLIGWATLPLLQPDVEIGTIGMTYCTSKTARTQIISNYNWTFTTDTEDCTNAAPTDITLSNNSIESNNAIGDIIGLFTTADDDVDDIFTYALVAGSGDTDNGSFTIDGNSLLTTQIFDFAIKSEYTIRIQTSDLIDTFEKSFIINVTEQDLTAPNAVTLTPVNNAIDVSINTGLTVTYDEELVAGSGLAEIREVTSGTVIASFDISEATLNVNSLSFTLSTSLDFGTQYSVIIPGTYVKDASDNFSSAIDGSWVFTTVKDNQTITFEPLVEKTFGEETFGLSSTASSGLAVSYNSSDETVATIDGTSVTIVGAGITTITASQAGDDTYASANAAQELVVNKAGQAISIESISDKDIQAADFEITATTSSGLALSYAVLSGPATIAGSTVSLTGETGTVEIEVNQAGSENFLAATATTSFSVLADPCADFAATAAVVQNVSCNGGADGSFSVNPTAGTGPFTYIMGETSQEIGTFENLEAGTYEVSVTDANGCSATASVEITAPEALTATAETTDSNSIFGNGSISLTAAGGTGAYTYSWSNGGTTATLSDLATGEYTVSITDEAGCSLTESYTIGGVTSNAEAFEMRMYPNPVVNQLQIRHGEGVEQISLLDATGKIIQQEQAMNSQSTVDMKSLPAGLYFIRLDDGQMKRIIKQ